MTADLIARIRGLCHDEINAGSSSALVVASLELCTAMEHQTEAVERYLANCDAIMKGEEPPKPAEPPTSGPCLVNERELLGHMARDGYPPNRIYARVRLSELDLKEGKLTIEEAKRLVAELDPNTWANTILWLDDFIKRGV